MYNNPFDAWTQSSSGQTNALLWERTSASPSVFGALPYPNDPAKMLSFYFTSYKPNIFNCSVTGQSSAHPQYTIVTDNQMPGYTLVKNAQGKNVSLVEWQQTPSVEIRGMVSKQPISKWLLLSPQMDCRSMDVGGARFKWVPQNKTIGLYRSSPSGISQFMGRINRSNGVVILEMTPEAMELGLLEATITACLLFQCGRNIDQ